MTLQITDTNKSPNQQDVKNDSICHCFGVMENYKNFVQLFKNNLQKVSF